MTTLIESNPLTVSENMLLLARLYELQSILVNMNTNLQLINQGAQGQTIYLNNANLYQLACKYYGDAKQWTTIANANGLTDPLVTGGSISRVSIESGGSNYTRPTLTIVGEELIKANLAAVVVDGVITSISVVTPGKYKQQPSIAITDSTGSGASVTAICTYGLTIPQSSISTNGVLIN